jgi:hypothetical protein
MAWFDRNNTNNEPGGENKPQAAILTDTDYERIAENVFKKIQLPDINAAIEANPVLQRLNASLDASEQARKTREQQARQQTQQMQHTEFETAYNELDPEVRQVVDTRFNQVNERSLRVEAREVRRSVFEDMDNYPYYIGDIKKKVDDMLDLEPLTTQVNPNVVKNAYKVVIADHIKELQENKLRSRLSGATGSSTTANVGTPDPNALPTLSAEEANYAKSMGIDPKEWAKSKKEMMEAGEVAGV